MSDLVAIKKVIKYCIANLDFEDKSDTFYNYYSCLPLCVVDSVFSIGVHYSGVANAVTRLWIITKSLKLQAL